MAAPSREKSAESKDRVIVPSREGKAKEIPQIPGFEIPSWAGIPAHGLHLDVMKGDKMIEKFIIDQKKCYFFGRNAEMCDFVTDHASCSRVHSALVYHKYLNRAFLIDLNSTHGTFIGTIRLESFKPTQVLVDSTIGFGASTRKYIIREKPQTITQPLLKDSEEGKDSIQSGLLGLPEDDTELENLTEFNTAHNKRVALLMNLEEVTPVDVTRPKRKRKHSSHHITFNESEEVINPEDIDPSVGRFRNLVQTAIIPVKKLKADISSFGTTDQIKKRIQSFNYSGPSLYGDVDSQHAQTITEPSHITELHSPTSHSSQFAFQTATLGMHVPNLAPDVDQEMEVTIQHPITQLQPMIGPETKEPRKKVYMKEVWPGKKPIHNMLM